MALAPNLVSHARALAANSATGPVNNGGLTIGGYAVGDHEYAVKNAHTLSTFTESEWFSATADSVSSWLIVKGNLTIPAGVTVAPSARKLFTVLYVAGDLVLDGTISMTARGANHGPNGSNIEPAPLAVASSQVIAALGGAPGLGVKSDAAAGGAGSTGVGLVSSGGGGGGGSRYNASYGGPDVRGGHGAQGTVFAGGPGGGGNRCGDMTNVDGGVYGGHGGAGSGDGFQSNRGGGGAGTPPMANTWGNPGGDGTGGTLIVLVEGTISGTGSTVANGVNGSGASGDTGGGGGSGGGIVLVLSGTGAPALMQATGGSGGGGNGVGGSGGDGYAARAAVMPPIESNVPNIAISKRNVTDQTRFVVRVDLAKLEDFWDDVEPDLSNVRVRTLYDIDLPFDLVSYDYANRTGTLYFGTDVTTTTDITLMIKGVPGATAVAPTDPNGRNAVWADYDCVYIFEGNENVDRAGKAAALTLGSGVTIADGRLNCAGSGLASVSGLPARTSWTHGVTFLKTNTTQARIIGTGTGPRMLVDNGTTLGVYDGSWLYPTPNPALSNNVPYRAHQVWNGAASRAVYREGGSLAGGTGSQNTDASVVQASPTQIELGGDSGSELLTGWINRFYSRPEALSASWIALEEKAWEDDRVLTYTIPSTGPTITSNEPAVSSAVIRWDSAGEPGYQVRVDEGPAIDVPANQYYYEFTGLLPGLTYSLEVRSVNPLGASPWAAVPSTTITALYYDNFNRANVANGVGSPQAGGPYTVRTGTWGINNNSLYTSASVAESQMTFPGAIDFDMTLNLGVFGSNGGFLFRWIDASNTWLVNWSGTVINLYRRTSGTYNQMGLSAPRNAATSVRIVAVGRLVQVFRDDDLVLQAEDHFYPVATATCGYRFSSETNTRLDEAILMAGAIATNPPADIYTLDEHDADPANEGLIYKGRDSKLADEGAVA